MKIFCQFQLVKIIFCEEHSHPHLFPIGKFRFQIKRPIPLNSTKYFNQCFLIYPQKFSSDSDYINFALKVMQSFIFRSQTELP